MVFDLLQDGSEIAATSTSSVAENTAKVRTADGMVRDFICYHTFGDLCYSNTLVNSGYPSALVTRLNLTPK